MAGESQTKQTSAESKTLKKALFYILVFFRSFDMFIKYNEKKGDPHSKNKTVDSTVFVLYKVSIDKEIVFKKN